MKKKICGLAIILMFAFNLQAQQPEYRVVFDMTTKDSVNQQALIRQMELIRKNNPEAKLEVVFYGQSLGMIVKDQSKYTEPIGRILANKNTSFAVCAITMQRYNVDESRLIPGVKVVPDGIYEIITRQHEGWGYIKVAN